MAHDFSISFLPAGAGASKTLFGAAALVLAAALAGCATKGSHSGIDGSSYATGRGAAADGTATGRAGQGGGRDSVGGGATGRGGQVAGAGSRRSGPGGTTSAGGAGGDGMGDPSLSGDNAAGGAAGSSRRRGAGGTTGLAGAGGDGMGDASLYGDDAAGGQAGSSRRRGPGGTTGVSGAGGDGMGDASLYGDDAAGGHGAADAGARGGRVAGVGGAGRGGDALGGESGRNAAGAGGRGSRSGVPGAGGEDDPMIVGMVDAPGGRARVDEDVTPQTLGGMLPMVVGVDEQGQFDFDRALLRVDVKVVLDGLAVKLQDAEYDRLDIIGYSDRIGSDEYNVQLSERRAWAVARYLMQQGVPLTKIRVEGRGERESTLAATQCADLEREEMITCLQQDRRVQIEASIRKSHVKIE